MFTLVMPMGEAFTAVYATEYYAMGCPVDQFEVSYIEDDGSFTTVSCHSSFSEAKSAMKANMDYVVRYSKSYSPSKIVAMNSGLAYSYPGRKNSATLTLYQDPTKRDDSRYKTTYISNHYEMTYIDTCTEELWDIKSDGRGYIQIVMNGFEGYTDLEYTDLVPTKYIENNLGIWLGGLNTYENEGPFYVTPHQNYYELKDNGNYTDLAFHYYRAYPASGSEPLSYELYIDNAAGYPFMKKGVRYYSNDGINFYTDSLLTEYAGTAYNYYQFLPVRSKTSITADKFDGFLSSMKPNATSVLKNEGQTFIDMQNEYGCNAMIIFAMACLESAYGTSGYAVNRNNLFGWSAYDSSPNDASYFNSVSHCVQEQMGRNLRWFLDYTNRRYFGSCVGNKGAGFNVCYASDPYWGVKIASIAYALDKYANNRNGKLTDYNKYTIGFVKNNYNDVLYDSNISWNPNIYTSATSNTVLYTGQYGSHYQKDLTVIVLEEEAGRYKIQSTNNVENGTIITDDGVYSYDWSKSVGYIDTQYVTLLNADTVYQVDFDHVLNTSIREVELTSDTLHINGVGCISGFNYKDPSSVSQKVVFYDLNNEENTYAFNADVIDSDGYTLYDKYDYTYCGFDLKLNLKDSGIPQGSYGVKLVTTIGSYSMETYIASSYVDFRYMASKDDTYTYYVKMREESFYRMQFDILSLPDEISFESISKPSKRNSLAGLDNYSIDENGVIRIDGHAFIYYCDFDNKDSIEYNVYLVSDKGNCLKLDTKIVDTDIDYQKELGTSFRLDNISFVATSDNTGKTAFDLDGDYTVYLTIKNGSNYDVCEITNYGYPDFSADNGVKSATFYTSAIRKRLMLKTSVIGG